MPKGERGVRDNYATRRLFDSSKSAQARNFRGVDGEGGNVDEPGTLFGKRHQYLSLRAGEFLLNLGRPLRYDDCFTFLTRLPPNRIDVSYFFDYDVTMMVRTMPFERADRLLHRERRTMNNVTRPLDFDGWQLEYLPHKEFRVRDMSEGNRNKWYSISDTGTFFQTSFLNTITKWNVGTPEEREAIKRGKERRSGFEEFDAETEYYNALEVLHLETLMEEFRLVCEDTGYVPKKWQGPGNLAAAMLQAHGVPRRDEIPILQNESFRLLAQAAYYGGRFETTAVGPVSGPLFQYDINGAYVALLRSLPCLVHGSWTYVRERPRAGLWFGEISFNHDKAQWLYGFPVRRQDGTIFFPRQATGVYWSNEVAAAESAGAQTRFIQGWVYQSHCDCRWFSFVDDYYAQRLKYGKSTKGYVLKLAGNSIYGKLAQSIGYAPYANPVWAGIITAGCRAQLIRAYSQVQAQERYLGESCVMLATDGLFMTRRLSLPLSSRLGEWEETVLEDGMFIIQPGLYFTGEAAKSRGIERGKIVNMRPEFEETWKARLKDGQDHCVPVPVTNFVTAKQAILRRKWNLAGTWETDTRDVSFTWYNKRMPYGARSYGDYFGTVPYPGEAKLVSVPYGRMIGGGLAVSYADRYSDIALEEAERMSEQPDWVEPMFTRDDSVTET